MSDAVIELRDVTKSFGDVVAVDNVSLAIEQGEFFALLGPSGCGKTTMLRMLAGFEHPTSGDVLIRGRRMNDVPPYRRDTNLVFQQLALFPHMDVRDNVAFGLRVKGRPAAEVRDRVQRVLDLVELGGLGARRTHEISGGQQQRVAIARALVNEPAVLLLDEPLGALDLKLRMQMQLELKALQRRSQTTFVYVTHDQGEALAMADRIAVMNAGRIEQLAAPLEIYDRPATRFVVDFIGDTNFVRQNGRVVAVRPEQVQLTRQAAGAEGAIGATIVATMVVGPAVQCVVRTEDGQEVLVREQRARGKAGAESLEEGKHVFVSWSSEDALEIDATEVA